MIYKTILVVENNEINRTMLNTILADQYQVLEAENGEEALSLLERYKDEISLILLDLVMPVMDGYTFLSIMKSTPDYATIPVIVTTQNDGETDEVAALAHGATDFVAKPYKPQVILHRVASIINLRETAAMVNQFQYDRLTGLYSKEFFYRKAKELLAQNPQKRYDVICSDIENFKLINDVFGIPAGDRLLCGIARLYTRMVNGRGLCGRFNADQFVCLLEHSWEYSNEMFRNAEIEISAMSNTRSVSMKWGVFAVVDRTIPFEQMCDRALLAARSIKGQYGKYFATYDDKLRNKLLREQAITDGMEAALKEGQFVIYLQPKYRIQDYQLAGAEALIRWNHPEWGFQSPAEFIPLFEKNGFITKLDQFVWDRTCAALRSWDDKGLPAIAVSVNVSRADIYNANLTDFLMNTVNKYGLSPSRLHLEITESAYTEDPNQIIETVVSLRNLGFIIEMDDFGSGYSSLNMLNQMPLDILKLDMKFIQSETAKPNKQGILRFIMGLARWMKLSVVAEGVETPEQMERLREIGCDYAQGYYMARPMPCDQFEELLREQAGSGEQAEETEESQQEDCPRQILLIADEDETYRGQVRELFKDQFEVVEAADGEAALGCIADYESRIGAVVLSLTLSGPDGFSVLEILQREKAVWNICAIATASADAGMEERALEMGADDFTGKPHTMKSLKRRVTRALRATQTREWSLELQQEASRDYLTGLLNRRGFQAAMDSLRKEDAPLALYLFDLDNLKSINDTFGHAEGDRHIRQFAQLLRSHTRESDILSRYGGDEFVVVMKQMKTDEAALKKGEEICRAIREMGAGGNLAACTAGVVRRNELDSSEELIERADQALYQAKKNNKGGCSLWRK